eukprot:scaffold1076_cov81-Skeletonema_dohrnii-CCMP3373.AAC.3
MDKLVSESPFAHLQLSAYGSIDEVQYPAESNDDAILGKRWMEMNERLPILKLGKGGWRYIHKYRLHHEKWETASLAGEKSQESWFGVTI